MTTEKILELEQKNQFIDKYSLQTDDCPGLYLVWNKIEIGTQLDLGFNEQNKKIAIIFIDQKDTDKAVIIGYVPLADENDSIFKILSSGWIELSTFIDCKVISKENGQIVVGLWIKEKTKTN
mgnify:CR=1 FL=1